MRVLYDTIGRGYRDLRVPDRRIASAILHELGDAADVLNIGAGAGSYEPADRPVLALEPSRTMLVQRPPGTAPAVQACATGLPFCDGAFDAALAILTVHHWPDRRGGLAEMRRVARRRAVLLTWDPQSPDFWLADYFPDLDAIDRGIFPTVDEIAQALGPVRVTPVPIPHDCTDGFLGAYWRRPECYLDANVRAAISTFSKLPDLRAGLLRLQRDLADGTWQRRHGDHLPAGELDLGYRLVTSDSPRRALRVGAASTDRVS